MKKFLIIVLETILILLSIVCCFGLLMIFCEPVNKFVTDLFSKNNENEFVFDFNGSIINEDGSISYNDILFTFEIDKESIYSTNGYVFFDFYPIDVKYDGDSNDNCCWTIVACDMETQSIMPVYVYDNEEGFSGYFYIGETPLNQLQLIFSGSVPDYDDVIVDDYLIAQEASPYSSVAKIKLFD